MFGNDLKYEFIGKCQSLKELVSFKKNGIRDLKCFNIVCHNVTVFWTGNVLTSQSKLCDRNHMLERLQQSTSELHSAFY